MNYKLRIKVTLVRYPLYYFKDNHDPSFEFKVSFKSPSCTSRIVVLFLIAGDKLKIKAGDFFVQEHDWKVILILGVVYFK